MLVIPKYLVTNFSKGEPWKTAAIVIGIEAIELAKMIGITPLMLSLMGRKVL